MAHPNDVFNEPPVPLSRVEKGALFELHNEYWDKSIDEDERAWVEEHGQLPENDDGSEVVPGCFTLHLRVKTKTFMVPKLWVRQDYWRIYDLCHRHYETVCTAREMGELPPVAIITGQPGIGESSSHRVFIIKHSYKKGKLYGFIMPCADVLVKPNHSFGTVQRSGIYL